MARYVEVLEFTHFVTMFEFDGDGHFRGNKCLIQKINCSVVLDPGWGKEVYQAVMEVINEEDFPY